MSIIITQTQEIKVCFQKKVIWVRPEGWTGLRDEFYLLKYLP